jgi:hypothetical protein
MPLEPLPVELDGARGVAPARVAVADARGEVREQSAASSSSVSAAAGERCCSPRS